jgi:hypothetical protein
VRTTLSRSALGAIAIALTVAGCGSSHNQPAGPSAGLMIRRAADVTSQAPGFKLHGYGTVTVSGAQHVTVGMSMAGSFDRRDREGSLTAVANAAGRQIHIRELVSRFTVYMASDSLPTLSTVSGGKPWIKLNISGAIPGGGLSSLPTTSDPAQFVEYLKAVSTHITKLGSATIHGVPTTGYRAVVDLNRYPSLVAPAQRGGVRRTIKTLEDTIGSNSMPMEVWIDSNHLVRRERYAFTECVSHLHESISLTTDMYDYGPQPKPRIPPASEVYDATPLASAALSHAKLGCS